MAVIITNMDMPKNCYDCDLHNYHECNLTTESIEEDYCWNGDRREKHCPLKSADKMIEEINNKIKELDWTQKIVGEISDIIHKYCNKGAEQ